MRIGLDGIPLVSTKTGIGHYTSELALALAKTAPDDVFQLISPIPFELPVTNNGPTPNLEKVIARKRKLWWAVGLPWYARHASLSLFHGTNYDIPLLGKLKTVVSIHDLSLLLHPETHLESNVRRSRYRLPLMARSATKIITATNSVKSEISEHLGIKPDKIAVTPYAPRQNFCPQSPPEVKEALHKFGIEKDFVLFVGTIEPRKNLATLLRAFAQVLKNSELSPQLVLAGQSGWMMNETLVQIEKEGLGGHVKLTGYISDSELSALYTSCRAFVYPSIYEGFGLPPLEAMACGAPVIVSEIPTLVEVAGPGAVVVPPLDVNRLARAIVELLTDGAKREHLAKIGKERAAEFTWERTAKMTLAVYEEVLSYPLVATSRR